MLCRTLAEVLAAADADSASVPPLSQAQVNYAAVLLAPHTALLAREPATA